MGLENVPRCQHVKVNGVQCGSPALRRKGHCFFHERVQYERKLEAQDKSGSPSFSFPLLEDANSIQVALMKVIQMLGSGALDVRTAGLMLYALQTASANLRHIRFEPEKLTDVVIDEDTVDLTRLSGPQWSSHDFSEKERERTKDKIEPPLPSSENSPPILAISETAAEVAARREQKRKLPLYSESNSAADSEDESQHSLPSILLNRINRDREQREASAHAGSA
jgi:hypothetical protein